MVTLKIGLLEVAPCEFDDTFVATLALDPFRACIGCGDTVNEALALLHEAVSLAIDCLEEGETGFGVDFDQAFPVAVEILLAQNAFAIEAFEQECAAFFEVRKEEEDLRFWLMQSLVAEYIDDLLARLQAGDATAKSNDNWVVRWLLESPTLKSFALNQQFREALKKAEVQN